MNLSLWAVICSITVSCLTVALAGENANSKKTNPANGLKDLTSDDDDDVDGSGFGESRDDLEESSGSGLGPPDDEDVFVDTNPKPKGPTLSSPPGTKSIMTPPPKHFSEPAPNFNENSRPNPVETVPTENKDVLNNPDLDGTMNRAIIPKKLDEPVFESHPDDKNYEDNKSDSSGVYKVNQPDRDRATSFFAQPGILAAVIGGAVVGLMCAILVVMFIVYRMRKKDEGSYPLEEMKRCPASNPYMKPNHREFFA